LHLELALFPLLNCTVEHADQFVENSAALNGVLVVLEFGFLLANLAVQNLFDAFEPFFFCLKLFLFLGYAFLHAIDFF
jgi:hypothetical protein